MTIRVQAVIEYDGTAFHGWQAQAPGPGAAPGAAVRTVQGELERALAALCGLPVEVCGASRTDVGVHACGQAAHIDLPEGLAIPPERWHFLD